MKKFIIFDNGGQTVDRFTIINKETGDIFGCSDTPNAPGCAGGLIGNCVSEVDNYINNARLDPDWLGREVDLINLPMNVKHFISRLTPDTPAGNSSKVNIVYMSPGSETASSGSRR